MFFQFPLHFDGFDHFLCLLKEFHGKINEIFDSEQPNISGMFLNICYASRNLFIRGDRRHFSRFFFSDAINQMLEWEKNVILFNGPKINVRYRCIYSFQFDSTILIKFRQFFPLRCTIFTSFLFALSLFLLNFLSISKKKFLLLLM